MTLAYGFALVATRVTAMLVSAPVFGNRNVPMYVRFILAALISLALAPLVFSNGQPLSHISEPAISDLFAGFVSEALIGGMIGIGILIIFTSAQLVGSAIGQMSGIQIDSMVNSEAGFGQLPTERLIGILAVVVFVLIGGPELLLTAVLDSFASIPVGHPIEEAPALALITSLLSQSFELTVRAIAPAIATVLASTFVVGLLTRTMPQLNLIQLGLSSNITIMLLAIFLTLGGCIWLVVDDVEPAILRIGQTLESMNLQAAN